MATREEHADGASSFSRAWGDAQAEARGIGETIGRITAELRVLSQREMDLARAEMLDTKDAATSAGIWGGVAIVFALVMLNFLALAGMLALMLVLEPWAAALVTAGVLLVIVAIAAFMARNALREVSVVPSRAIRSVQEDVRWAREHVQRNNAS